MQSAAIEAPPGPALVLAGPGAGKTFCLIRRVEHLINVHRLPPERICAVTFTNKAAEEVTSRLHNRLGDRADAITRGTLHRLCLGILRQHPEEVGLRRGFGVADEEYQQLLLRRLNVYSKHRRQLLTLFGRHRLQSYELTEGDDALFDSYISRLRERNLVDFDDIISLTQELLRARQDIATDVAGRWDCLLVDEFQDLDAAQYSILKRLGEAHRNIFAVGDDEQSIFAWRGSDPRILWRFCTDFDIETPIILDRNWRCSRPIFQAARRLLRENPELFQKNIEAQRSSEFEVEAYSFEDDAAEAQFILERILGDRSANELSWGDFAVLYRNHRVGRRLENHLVAAGVPCRLARGRALLDDPVIAYVIASLRVISDPDDPVAVEAFADRMLPHSLTTEVRTMAATRREELLPALRVFARGLPRPHPDAKKAWRFIFHVENLRALSEAQDTLSGLVDDLLSQRVRPYDNRLEERYEELEDPETFPGAGQLAERLRATVGQGGKIYIEPAGGRGIALRGMLLAAELPAAIEYLSDATPTQPSDLTLSGTSASGRPAITSLFKALQLIHSRDFASASRDYVTFDLETTDIDASVCEIIEIGAAKVRNDEVVGTFQSLIRADRPISSKASEVHGYRDEHLRDAPRLEQVWPDFRAFVGDNILVAHNAHSFDVPVLRRLVSRFASVDDLIFYDTLPLARSLFRESAKLSHLAERFGVELPRAHHALDDAVALAHVFRGLGRLKVVRARKAALVNLLDYLALGLALEEQQDLAGEDQLLFELGARQALGRFSDCLEFYDAERQRLATAAPGLDQLIERLGGRQLMERIRAERRPAERYPSAVARLQSLIEVSQGGALAESVARLLERVALSTSEGVEADPHRVNLLTLHSTKGLEFSRVYIVGVEDYQIPGYYAAVDNLKDEIDEARRLLYVGMTRTRDRLVLTRADRRRGKDTGGSLFLDEIGLAPTRP